MISMTWVFQKKNNNKIDYAYVMLVMIINLRINLEQGDVPVV